LIEAPSGTRRTTIHWTDGGGTNSREWIDVNNWSSSYLPGSAGNNDRLVMSAGDNAAVHCPATYITGVLSLEMRRTAAMDVASSVVVGWSLSMSMSNSARVSQSGVSSVTVGGGGVFLHPGTSYTIRDTSQLSVGSDIFLSGYLTIGGENAVVACVGDLVWGGSMKFELGSNGVLAPVYADGVRIDPTARLILDVSDYVHTSDEDATFSLVEGTSWMSGELAAENVIIEGDIQAGVAVRIVQGAKSLDVSLSPVEAVASNHGVITELCPQYLMPADAQESASYGTFYWQNTGADSEWLNVANWGGRAYLPGTNSDDRLIFAAGDHATVSCPATYMGGKVAVEMRTKSTLDVSSDLNIGRYFSVSDRAIVTQSSSSLVVVSQDLTVYSANYFMRHGAQCSASSVTGPLREIELVGIR
jgi:hypothetical protein